jgi:hypothetical protein
MVGRQSRSGLPGRYEPFCWEGVAPDLEGLLLTRLFNRSFIFGRFAQRPSVAEVAEGDLPSAPASQARFNLPESAPPLAG